MLDHICSPFFSAACTRNTPFWTFYVPVSFETLLSFSFHFQDLDRYCFALCICYNLVPNFSPQPLFPCCDVFSMKMMDSFQRQMIYVRANSPLNIPWSAQNLLSRDLVRFGQPWSRLHSLSRTPGIWNYGLIRQHYKLHRLSPTDCRCNNSARPDLNDHA